MDYKNKKRLYFILAVCIFSAGIIFVCDVVRTIKSDTKSIDYENSISSSNDKDDLMVGFMASATAETIKGMNEISNCEISISTKQGDNVFVDVTVSVKDKNNEYVPEPEIMEYVSSVFDTPIENIKISIK